MGTVVEMVNIFSFAMFIFVMLDMNFGYVQVARRRTKLREIRDQTKEKNQIERKIYLSKHALSADTQKGFLKQKVYMPTFSA